VTGRQMWIRAAVPIGVAAGAAILRAPYAVVVGLAAVAVLTTVVRTGRAVFGDRRSSGAPRLFEAAARARSARAAQPPREIERMATLVSARSRSAGGVHHWLRPLMRDLALARIDPGTVPTSWNAPDVDPVASATIPDPLRSLIAPDRPRPVDPSAPGISLAEVTVLVDQLEAL
jgi:hypothetical protein